MKNIVIAAGYATRLYPLTENFPKPLLEVGGNTILGRLIDDIDRLDDINEHVIVTNHKFVNYFEQWAAQMNTCKPIRIIDDGTVTNEGRLGAVRDLLLALEKLEIDEDVLVIAADNILTFSFAGFVDYFKQKRTSLIMCHREEDVKKLQRTGVVEVDADMRVLGMEEKPQQPRSHWAVPPFYVYRKEDLPLIRDCMAHGCGGDAPGNLAIYLSRVTPLHAWPMPGQRYDIGTLESYEEVRGMGL